MSFYQKFIRPLLFRLPPETAHNIAIKALKFFPASKEKTSDYELERFGLKFTSPLGVAAGFDKNGVAVNELAGLGFGFVEVGTVTLRPQKGNEKPRMFRLPQDEALINRLGFNNDGANAIVERLQHCRSPHKVKAKSCIVGINIGKNKDVPNEEAVENYLHCFDEIRDIADYVGVNVSSPNTPGLRDLQQAEQIEKLLEAIQLRNAECGMRISSGRDPSERDHSENLHNPHSALRNPQSRLPILLKIAPDVSDAEIEQIADVCLRVGIAGIIATNTTTARDNLKTENIERFGAGGLSGRPLRNRSNAVISKLYSYSKGRLPIIGAGGIFTAEDAFEKIAAGACLLQAYTGFIYRGPSFARDINRELAELIKTKGFAGLDEAIGSGL